MACCGSPARVAGAAAWPRGEGHRSMGAGGSSSLDALGGARGIRVEQLVPSLELGRPGAVVRQRACGGRRGAGAGMVRSRVHGRWASRPKARMSRRGVVIKHPKGASTTHAPVRSSRQRGRKCNKQLATRRQPGCTGSTAGTVVGTAWHTAPCSAAHGLAAEPASGLAGHTTAVELQG